MIRLSDGRKLAVAGMMAAAVAAPLLFAPAPSAALLALFAGPLSDAFRFARMLGLAGLLCLTGLGVSFAFRSGSFNLGGEGQAATGALAAALAASAAAGAGLPGFAGIPVALAAGTLAGAAVSAFSGWLRRISGTDAMISSYLVSAALIALCDYLIGGPLRDPDSYLLTTKSIPAAYRMANFTPGSGFGVQTLFAVALTLAAGYLLRETTWGYRMRMSGSARDFALHGGIRVERYEFGGMALSGALHGLAGALLVCGRQFAALQGGSAGLGWSGIAVALIAANDPWRIVPAALFYAWIDTGVGAAMVDSGMGFDLGFLVQAAVFILVTARFARSGGGGT